DGFPAGYKINFERLLAEVAKRRPGQAVLVTARKETDTPEFLSGISPDGITLGTPIGFIVRNADHHSSDYDEMAKASAQAMPTIHILPVTVCVIIVEGGGRVHVRR
ncbi:MAG: chorismate synthase, partial [Muribaculaceae bacterium]|nr:chorismate synthase [Muribaculaceae bacterium]